MNCQLNRTTRTSCMASIAVLISSIAMPVSATEGGGSVYPNGVENFVAGAVPPPGIYGLLYGTHYTADRVKNKNGDDQPIPGFKLTANVVASRFVWVTGVRALGGDLTFHAIVPIVDLKLRAGGSSFHKSGIGDSTVGIAVGHHFSANLHSAMALNVFLPTGAYDKSQGLNLGRNYFAVEPMYAVTYVSPNGFNGDIKAGYIFNARNKDTEYRSGREFHFDYAIGWGLGKSWTVGAGGYVYQQVTDDSRAGVTVDGSKGRAFAIGPSVKYDSGKGWFATAKWQKESAVRNRAQGDAIWLKAVFPL
jgi:hypothetical protein